MLRSPLGSRQTQMASPLGVGGGAGGAWYAGAYAAYDAKNAASYAASLLDLTGNGRHATTGVQPGWSNGTGWTFNGVSHYLKTGVIPVNNQQWSMAIKFNSVTPKAAVICGCYPGGFPVFYIIPANSNVNSRYYGNGNQLIIGGMQISATMIVAGNNGYLNGSLETGTIASFSGTFTGDIYIGCVNSGVASPVTYLACTVTSFEVWNYTLSAAQAATISAAMP